ncbi:unnamed protein product [Closterium sp. NIES-65]|nr:unnamed protein product [Closterium sp. NIES-65]
MGSFMSSLSSLSATQLGAIAIRGQESYSLPFALAGLHLLPSHLVFPADVVGRGRGAVGTGAGGCGGGMYGQRADLGQAPTGPADVEEVYMGNVQSADLGQAPTKFMFFPPFVLAEAVGRSGLGPADVEEVYMGNVLSADLGQAPARQAALGAGLPDSVVATTVNKRHNPFILLGLADVLKLSCRGMTQKKAPPHSRAYPLLPAAICLAAQAIMLGLADVVVAGGIESHSSICLAAQAIMLGLADVVVAGGMESMSNAPYYLNKARSGYRFGHGEMVDGVQRDGLSDAYSEDPMGCFAEQCAEEHGIAREQQDEHATATHERAAAAHADGAFDWEIVPVEVKASKGKQTILVERDEPCAKFDANKLRLLRPCFKENGTVTAGNASAISDGAAAVVLASRQAARQHGLNVLAVLRGFGDAEQAPNRFTTAPALAVPVALKHAGVEQSEVDYWEINEAFSVVALANQKLLNIPEERLNVHGGAVALGHPLGSSGARIVVSLLGVLRKHEGRLGVAAVCNGGGGASALVVQAE